MATLKAPKRGPQDWSALVKKTGSGLPSRIVVYGTEGVGKTSWAAHAPSPIFLMAKGETGLETLIDNNQLGDVPHFPETSSFEEACDQIDWLANSKHEYKTLVLDTLNGLEQLVYDHVCKRDYGGVWEKFCDYGKGYGPSAKEWRIMLSKLDRVREAGAMVLGLAHAKVSRFVNPEGGDFDRYQADLRDSMWGLTSKWADAILFMNFFVEVNPEERKGRGGQQRVIHPVHHAAYDAKNRFGLEEMIPMGTDGASGWANFRNAIMAVKEMTGQEK